ncbi:alkaline shock response membrane anchor protein AmaP [Actinomadura sp. DC4]|uniref:alkaline shock response membrane anchor protein AmaP n=1 Tax=Actinomadura sp. DC4 TaxID=3055069 RepID=UPI0025B17E7E|nr:alkaline shock response membrane anchor protein AmaP [Actinomadura sp. DC4]MDN3351665.1 alkaline shock response membrane anchor protein AmaP [Actinomadura sp. DC4]
MGNRVWLALTGLVLLGTGGTTLGLGVFRPGRPLVTGATSRWISAHPWFWASVSGVALAVAMLGTAWLSAQWRRRTLRRLAMGDARAGATRMAARVAARAIAADVTSYPGVRQVRTRLAGSARRPSMRVLVMCDAEVDLAELSWRIRDDAMVRLRTTLNRDDLGGVVDFRMKRADPAGARRVV